MIPHCRVSECMNSGVLNYERRIFQANVQHGNAAYVHFHEIMRASERGV